MEETSSSRAVAPLLAVWLLQLAAFFTPSATWSPMSRFALTHAFAAGDGFALGAWADATGDRARVGEVWYSDKAPLPALLAAIPYDAVRGIHLALGYAPPAFQAESRGDVPATRVQLNTSAQQLLYASAVGVSGVSFVALGLALRIMLRRRFDERASLVATVLVCLGTPVFPYATSFYGHVPAAAFLTIALSAVDPRAPSPRLLLAGLCLSAAVGCEYLTAIPGVVIAAFAVLTGPRATLPHRAAQLAAGALPLALALGAYHHVCFGAPWRTGYSHLSNPVFVSGHQRGFMGIGLPSLEALGGLLMSNRRGLFYLAPITALAVVGLVFPRERAPLAPPGEGAPVAPPGEGGPLGVEDGEPVAVAPPAVTGPRVDPTLVVGALALLALFLANAGYYMWWGGASAGPRHLVPMLPVLAFGVARLWLHPAGRVLVVVVGALSIIEMLAFTAVGIEAPETGDAIFDFILPRLNAGEVSAFPSATNLGLLLGLPPLVSVVPWLAWFALVGRILWIRSEPA